MRIVTRSSGPIEQVAIAELTEALTAVMSKGLPVSEELAGEILPNLKSVYARSIVPSDRLSRISALNQLLPRLIASIADGQFRESAQALFGLSPGTMHASHAERMRRAAAARGYSLAHFREVIEGQMLESVAQLIYDDLLRYRSRVKRSAESLESTGDTPRLGPEHLTHEEELVSRIWQHVYGLRAELIAFTRLSSVEGFEATAEDHRQLAMQTERELKAILAEFVETYGRRPISHGEAAFDQDALERLVGWGL